MNGSRGEQKNRERRSGVNLGMRSGALSFGQYRNQVSTQSKGVPVQGGVCSVAFMRGKKGIPWWHCSEGVVSAPKGCTTSKVASRHAARASKVPARVASCGILVWSRAVYAPAACFAQASSNEALAGGRLAAVLPCVPALLLQPPLHPLPKVQRAALVCSKQEGREKRLQR